MDITVALTMLLVIIAIGITYVAHLQRKMLESQETLISHFIDLVKAEISGASPKSNNDKQEIRDAISRSKLSG